MATQTTLPIRGPLFALRGELPDAIENSDLGLSFSFQSLFKAYRVGWKDASKKRHCLRVFRARGRLYSTLDEVRDLLARIAEGDRLHHEAEATKSGGDEKPASTAAERFERPRLARNPSKVKPKALRRREDVERRCQELGV